MDDKDKEELEWMKQHYQMNQQANQQSPLQKFQDYYTYVKPTAPPTILELIQLLDIVRAESNRNHGELIALIKDFLGKK